MGSLSLSANEAELEGHTVSLNLSGRCWLSSRLWTNRSLPRTRVPKCGELRHLPHRIRKNSLQQTKSGTPASSQLIPLTREHRALHSDPMTRALDQYSRGTLAQIVADFYGEVLRSPSLGPFFRNADMDRLIDHQSAFMIAALGGPSSYGRDEIYTAHQRLDISGEDFQEMLKLLERSLVRFGLQPTDITEVIQEYQRYEPQVVKQEG